MDSDFRKLLAVNTGVTRVAAIRHAYGLRQVWDYAKKTNLEFRFGNSLNSGPGSSMDVAFHVTNHRGLIGNDGADDIAD